jgi:hypothetical protein
MYENRDFHTYERSKETERALKLGNTIRALPSPDVQAGSPSKAGRLILPLALLAPRSVRRSAAPRVWFIEVPADADGPALNGAMWYPCSEPPDTGSLTFPKVRE